MELTPDHYLDLVDGKFAKTSTEELASMFDTLRDSPFSNNLVIHFHGGLVTRKAGMESAEHLASAYHQASAYPTFFIWNSGLVGSIAHNLDEIAKEPVFIRLVRRVAQFAFAKLKEAAGMRGGSLELDPIRQIPGDLEKLEEALDAQEDLNCSDVDWDLSKSQEKQLLDELEGDRVLEEEIQKIANGLRSDEDIKRDMATRGTSSVYGSTATRMSAETLDKIAERQPDGSRGLFTTAKVAAFTLGVLRRVLSRFVKGRDHGLYTTVVEEVVRGFYLDNAGILVWNMMKNDTRDAFEGDLQRHGGSAFADQLRRAWQPGQRVTLVGHSTGAIYIGWFLDAADGVLPPEAKFDVVFLAPACTFKFLHERLDVLRRRINGFRTFGLNDEIERGYWEVPCVYRGSLLYLVSGLFEEDEVDMPLVGMQRYYSATGPYDRPDVREVLDWMGDRTVWSQTGKGPPPGQRSDAPKHGGFPRDPLTLQSLHTILTEGV